MILLLSVLLLVAGILTLVKHTIGKVLGTVLVIFGILGILLSPLFWIIIL
jgi:hypothetical protein